MNNLTRALGTLHIGPPDPAEKEVQIITLQDSMILKSLKALYESTSAAVNATDVERTVRISYRSVFSTFNRFFEKI